MILPNLSSYIYSVTAKGAVCLTGDFVTGNRTRYAAISAAIQEKGQTLGISPADFT
jgi:hypothetical protein